MSLIEKRSSRTFRRSPLVALVVAACTALGCSDDGGGDTTTSVAPPTGTAPLYAMMIQVYTAEDRIVYAHLSKDLEVGAVDLSQAREFASVANFAGIGGRIYVSSGTEPEITEFGISDDLAWTEGRSISFSGFPLEDNANFYYQYVLDDSTAYMPFDGTSRIVWNPTDMVIEGTMTDTSVPAEQNGMLVATGGNRNAIQFDGPVQQPFFYSSELDYGPESIVAVYDADTNRETTTVTLPCPGLSMASQDSGYTYYGTWGFLDRALFGIGPEPCIARLTPERTLDEAWTTNLEQVTGGRPHNNFRAVGGGKAIANVLHTEELVGASFDNGYDQDVVDQIASSGPWWKLWLIDLDTMTGAPVAGIDVDTASGAQFAVLDGRTFVFLPYNDWGRSKIYEIGSDGVAIERGDTVGDVFKWVKVR
ncbi:MAG TPA: hypothetical protein VMG12_29165 [Polyangiaceae bacterium]|nr:hypothetical protein [Polyangiaceae bacterium]